MNRHRIVLETRHICLVVATTLLLVVGPAYAQFQLEEVIVTAQKREQSLNEIGISITSFTGENLRESGIFQPQDLASQTSNLNVNNVFGESTPNISIRGLGLNDYAMNNNPAVGIYTDEVYLVSPGMLSFQLFDIERIEVLKGPQGTLYGRNTNAGAINFISKKPSSETNGYVSVGYGRYDRFDFEAAAGGEISPGFMGRVAVQTTQQNEGHLDNRATGKDVGEIDRLAWRGLLGWSLSEQADILLNIHSGRDESDTYLVKVDNTLTSSDNAFYPGDPFSSAGRPETYMDVESEGASLSVNWDLSDVMSLKSISAYEDFSRHYFQDLDGTAIQYLDGEFMNDIEQYSQELRLIYNQDDMLLIAGAFYGRDEVVTRDNFLTVALTGGLATPLFSLGNEYEQETESFAMFVHTELLFGGVWNLTLGVRYTDEKKEFDKAFAFFTLADSMGMQASNLEIMAYTPVSNTGDYEDFSGKIGLDYQGFEDALFYASISKGFKSGGFQGQLTFMSDDLSGFDEENVLAYELGFKWQLLNNSLQLNGSAFFYDYTDIQLYGSLFQDPNLGVLFGILNVGDAEVLGAELDMLWRPVENLDFRAGLGLLDTEITKSTNSWIKKGSDLPNSPDINFNVSVNYERPISNFLGEVMLSANYKGDTIYDIVREPTQTMEGGYWLVNARIGIKSDAKTWEIYAWAKNLVDKEYRAQVLTTSIGYPETWGLPRTYGVTVNYAF